MASSYNSCPASWPISRNGEPASSKCRTRSRTSSFPRAWCLERASAVPPSPMRTMSARNSAASLRLVSALRRDSSPWRFSALWMAGMCAASGAGFEQLAPDQHAADFAGPRPDLIQFRISQESSGGIVIDVTVAAQRLNRVESTGSRTFGREQDAARGIEPCRLPAIAGPRDSIDIGARRIECGVQVGNFRLHELKAADRLTKLAPLLHVRQHGVEARLHDPERSTRQHHTLIVESAHQYTRALAHFVQHIGKRHLAVAKHQLASIGAPHAELVELLGTAESR